MALVHAHEDRLIRQLPPNAQHICKMLLSRLSLVDMVRMQETGEMDLYLLAQHKVSQDLWSDILKAIILAKITYFEPSPLLDQTKILLLVKMAVETAGFSLNTPLPQIVNAVKNDYPRLTHWLTTMAQLLAKQRKPA